MPDPVTIGAIVATALATAASESFKMAVGESVKDAYKKLKEKISHWGAGEVDLLEADPTSETKQAVVAEVVDRRTEQEWDALRVLAQTLIDELRNSGHAVGLDFSDLRDVEIDLKDLSAEGGATAARVQRMEGGRISASGVTAKDRSGN